MSADRTSESFVFQAFHKDPPGVVEVLGSNRGRGR